MDILTWNVLTTENVTVICESCLYILEVKYDKMQFDTHDDLIP